MADVTRASEPILVTTAGKSPRDEQRDRARRYLITMGVRTLMFVLAVVLYALHLKWEAGVTAAASLVLPWVAVVAANAGPTRQAPEQPALYLREPPKGLGAGRD